MRKMSLALLFSCSMNVLCVDSAGSNETDCLGETPKTSQNNLKNKTFSNYDLQESRHAEMLDLQASHHREQMNRQIEFAEEQIEIQGQLVKHQKRIADAQELCAIIKILPVHKYMQERARAISEPVSPQGKRKSKATAAIIDAVTEKSLLMRYAQLVKQIKSGNNS